VPGPLRQ